MGNMSGQQRADRLIDRVFKRPPTAAPAPDGQPVEPKSPILRSLNRQRRRLDDMKRGL